MYFCNKGTLDETTFLSVEDLNNRFLGNSGNNSLGYVILNCEMKSNLLVNKIPKYKFNILLTSVSSASN